MEAFQITPPGSPRAGPPAPLRREPPAGPDPYVEDRNNAQNDAHGGAVCPVNQHGCYYFSASEWSFCPMCEWETGHRAGEQDGSLAYMGGLATEDAADRAAGRTLRITRAGLDQLFQAPATRSFLGLITEWQWLLLVPDNDGHVTLTRKQLHNLLMTYGSPHGCLTDHLWLDLQARWPPAFN